MRRLLYLLFITLIVHAGASVNLSLAQGKGCPAITIEGKEDVCPYEPVAFTARVAGQNTGVKLTYEWTLSEGKIEGGQGTDTIVISPEGIIGKKVKATVKIAGIDAVCNGTASQETQVFSCCISDRLFDQYGSIAFNDEKARLDNFAIQLQNEPTAAGYIITYAGRTTFHGEAVERADRAKNYLTASYNFMDDRIYTLDGGFREDPTVELWIVAVGGVPPSPSPTLMAGDVRIIDKPVKDRPARKPR